MSQIGAGTPASGPLRTSVPPYQVLYRRNDERVQRPEDAARYIPLLNQAPIYHTAQAAPCAAMTKEAERMNAAQE